MPIDSLLLFSNTVTERLPTICRNCRCACLATSLPLTTAAGTAVAASLLPFRIPTRKVLTLQNAQVAQRATYRVSFVLISLTS